MGTENGGGGGAFDTYNTRDLEGVVQSHGSLRKHGGSISSFSTQAVLVCVWIYSLQSSTSLYPR